MESRFKTADSLSKGCQSQLKELQSANTDLNGQVQFLNKRLRSLEIDSSETNFNLKKYKELTDMLENKYEKLLQENGNESKKNLDNLNVMETKLLEKQKELDLKEEKLKQTQLENDQKTKNLQTLQEQLDLKEKKVQEQDADLKQREQKIQDLTHALNAKDSINNALKNTLTTALLGYKDQGLDVSVKNGKVYVSMDEKLLFASGSTVVDPKGRNALVDLAKILEKNPDIQIMVEGHTDDVPLKSGAIMKDNWDLSVLRATSIVRILTDDGKLDPKRITSSGRGEYYPVDPGKTSEARKKNRRTEIILTPKLDPIYQILETK